MTQLSRSWMASAALCLVAACSAVADGGEDDESHGGVKEIGSAALGLTLTPTLTLTLTNDCQINPDETAFCAETAVAPVSGRQVFYRIGDNTGPGYDASIGRHAAVFLFQGTSLTGTDDAGGANGPGATWSKPVSKPGPAPEFRFQFGIWYQVATVVALVHAGYTVIQPAARRMNGTYFWDTNRALLGRNRWSGSPDQALMNALIAQIQPGSTTFGAIDIDHVYATGISSGGYMSSRIANEYAAGIQTDGSVVSASQPFRAVAIQSGAYQACAGDDFTFTGSIPDPRPNCIAATASQTLAPISATHAPTFFLHDAQDKVVPVTTMMAYLQRLDDEFPGGNPAYTVDGVRETFLDTDDFSGNTQPTPHHEWDNHLTGASDNLILQWFSIHR